MTTRVFNLCGFGKDLYCKSKGNAFESLFCLRNSRTLFSQCQDCSILSLNFYILEVHGLVAHLTNSKYCPFWHIQSFKVFGN